MRYFQFLLVLLITLTFACKPKSQADQGHSQGDEIKISLTDSDKKLMLNLTNKCYNCHQAEGLSVQKIAPSMLEIKEAYHKMYKDSTAFIRAFTNFVVKPDAKKSAMSLAMEAFGLMPNMGYNSSEIEPLAKYIYSKPIDSKPWLEAVEKVEEEQALSKENEENDPKNIGKNIALATKSELGKNLMMAISNYQTEGAVSFCNTKELPITDSMAALYNATIARVSDKPRNELNRANEQELKYISLFEEQIAQGFDTKPIVITTEKEHQWYSPIVTNTMCLQCHGIEGEDINTATLIKIKEKYPNDSATGYTENQVRGIWRITWPRL